MAKETQPTIKKEANKKLAVIKTGGKQYIVSEDDVLEIELVEGEEGKEIIFSEVLLYADGEKIEVGKPILENVKVRAIYNNIVKGDKQIIFKYKAKKNYRVKTGHRQKYTQIKIVKNEKK